MTSGDHALVLRGKQTASKGESMYDVNDPASVTRYTLQAVADKIEADSKAEATRGDNAILAGLREIEAQLDENSATIKRIQAMMRVACSPVRDAYIHSAQAVIRRGNGALPKDFYDKR